MANPQIYYVDKQFRTADGTNFYPNSIVVIQGIKLWRVPNFDSYYTIPTSVIKNNQVVKLYGASRCRYEYISPNKQLIKTVVYIYRNGKWEGKSIYVYGYRFDVRRTTSLYWGTKKAIDLPKGSKVLVDGGSYVGQSYPHRLNVIGIYTTLGTLRKKLREFYKVQGDAFTGSDSEMSYLMLDSGVNSWWVDTHCNISSYSTINTITIY